ncbi:MAG TPA: 1-(5-phosphoribosyl)-5-[(5-phosphoribosylamino)methylideneamino]imidazole-4-carboxamide isomerase [Thermoleophilia bacterium]|nr:1-(5-phosphoribosyl)-5-[(5-phosphoribosylamino)methylideneamino]imidazole-4-carboxamide isomerase [Thermoleophilia bacterium]
MILFPAVDIQGGRAVRLRQGDFDRATVFDDDPEAAARAWRDQGAQALHLVDLDGARSGRLVNFELVERVAAELDVPVQFGGGVRERDALARVAASAVRWVVLGTAAVTSSDLLDAAVETLGERLVVGVDCADGLIATHGWQRRSTMSAARFVHELGRLGVRRIVYTDVSRDGMLGGPDLAGLVQLAAATPLELVASGGISTLSDLRLLRRRAPANVVGAIVGRALYEGAFTVPEALEALA